MHSSTLFSLASFRLVLSSAQFINSLFSFKVSPAFQLHPPPPLSVLLRHYLLLAAKYPFKVVIVCSIRVWPPILAKMNKGIYWQIRFGAEMCAMSGVIYAPRLYFSFSFVNLLRLSQAYFSYKCQEYLVGIILQNNFIKILSAI